MNVGEAILEKVRELTPEKQADVLPYVSSLEGQKRTPFRSPKSILADLDFSLTEENLAEARREMWGDFLRKDIA